MSATLISEANGVYTQPQVSLTAPNDRRLDVDAKQAAVAALLEEHRCDGLLVLEPENFAWLTAGGSARGVLDTEDLPALYFSPEGRWVLTSNVDTARLFDEELDGLGFQLKEWPWHWGRTQLLADLCQGRAAACDRAFNGCKDLGPQLKALRRTLTPYEEACYRALGQIVGHALEAACRTLNPGDTEREVAGQLSHRLMHRGAMPLSLRVAADGRARHYRHCGFTSAEVRSYCLVSATARKYGLCATASRSVCLGEPEASVRRDHDGACKVSANYVASSWPDAVPKQIYASARRVYALTGAEHEWLLCPQGYLAGRLPVEMPITPQTEELLQGHTAITWLSSVGAAMSCDTFLITEEGARTLTVPDTWPLKRIRIQGGEFVRPDLLIR
jgi:Xaa-Pro dipeptidase